MVALPMLKRVRLEIERANSVASTAATECAIARRQRAGERHGGVERHGAVQG